MSDLAKTILIYVFIFLYDVGLFMIFYKFNVFISLSDVMAVIIPNKEVSLFLIVFVLFLIPSFLLKLVLAKVFKLN